MRRLIVFFIGVCFTLLLIEAGLRLFGSVYKNTPAQSSTKDKTAQADFVVLCLGDSRAFGLGAPKGQSFPEQLERSLNSLFAPKRISVINQGFPGDNTWQAKEKLKKHILAKQQTDLVVVIAGQNNFWNFKGLSQSTGTSGIYYWLQTNFHIVQLFALLKKNISQKEFSISDNLKNKIVSSELFTTQLQEDIQHIQSHLPENIKMETLDDISGITPQDIEYWTNQGLKQQKKRNDREFLHCANNAISLLNKEPESEEKKQNLSFLIAESACAYKRLGKYKKACLYFVEALKIQPLSSYHQDFSMTLLAQKDMWQQAIRASIRHLCLHPKENFPFISMSLWTQHEKREQLQKTIKDFALPIPAGLKQVLDSSYKSTDIDHWIETDLKEMILLCKKRQIPVFLLGDINQQTSEPRIYQRLANQHDTTYIKSQQQLLSQLEQKEIVTREVFNTYLAGDLDHPNEKGYAFMAECITKQIQKQKLL